MINMACGVIWISSKYSYAEMFDQQGNLNFTKSDSVSLGLSFFVILRRLGCMFRIIQIWHNQSFLWNDSNPKQVFLSWDIQHTNEIM